MHIPTRLRERLIPLTLAGALGFGLLGGASALAAQVAAHLAPGNTHSLTAQVADEGGPSTGLVPSVVGEGGPPPGH